MAKVSLCNLRIFLLLLFVSLSYTVFSTEKNTVRIGISEAYPLGYTDQGGRSKGYYIDLMNEIGKQEHFNTKYYIESHLTLLEKLRNNEIDIIFGIGYSEERLAWCDYSSVVIQTLWCQMYSHDAGITSPLELTGRKTGILESSISGQKFVDLIKSLKVNTEIVEYPTYNEIFKAVEDGSVDAGIVNNNYGYSNESQFKIHRTNFIFEPYGQYVLAQQGKQESLIKTIDIYMRKWKADKSSIYYTRYEYWVNRNINDFIIPTWIWQSLGVVVIVLLIFIGISIFLRRSVSRATKELSDANTLLHEENEKRKQSEIALRASEEKYRLLTDYSPDYIWTSDIQWNMLYVSPSVTNMLGYTPEEYLVTPKEVLFTPDSVQIARETFGREVMRVVKKEVGKDHSIKLELQMIRKNGSHCFIEVNCRGIFDQNENLVMVMGINRDISERKITEMKLKESEERFKQFVDNIEDIFWLEDSHANVIFINRAFEKIFQVPTNMVYMNSGIIKKFLNPADVGRFEKGKEDDYEKKAFETEYSINLPDGSVRWLWLKRFPIFDPSGKLYRRAGIASDITRIKNIQLELEKATEKAQGSDRLKSSFLANITHELRTPINGIMGFGQLMFDSPDLSEEHRMYTDMIINSSRRLVNIIDDLLDTSKIESGELQLDNRSFYLPDLINEIYQEYTIMLEKEDRREKLKFILKPDITVNFIISDERRVKQLLYNFLENAFKFTPAGEIELGYKLFKAQKYLEFYIKDTGIGIREDKLENIFERFRQGDETLTRTYEGTGLGLSICKGLIELMGGKVMVESELNKGSTFYFTIPYTEGSSVTDDQSKKTKKIHNWKNKTILIVEDDQYSFFYLKTLLERASAKVLHAKTGQHAIELCKKMDTISAVLMDIRLPDINGLEVTKKIREFNTALPIIAQTAHTFENDRDKCLKAGCTDYIQKPVTIDTIMKVMDRYLGKI